MSLLRVFSSTGCSLSPAALAQAVMILAYNLKMRGSNLVPCTDYSDRVFIFVVSLILASIVS
jgi:hypothetical protein